MEPGDSNSDNGDWRIVPFRKQVSLATRLVGRLAVILGASTVLSMALGAVVARSSAEEQLRLAADNFRSSLPKIYSLALWDYNTEAINNISDAFVQDPRVTSLEVKDTLGNAVLSYKRPGEIDFLNEKVDIAVKRGPAGSITIGLGLRAFEEGSYSLVLNFGWFFLGSLTLVFFIFRQITHRTISQPMTVLGTQVQEFAPGDQNWLGGVNTYSEVQPFLDRLRAMGLSLGDTLAALKTSENRFRSILEFSPVALALSQADGTISSVNQAFQNLTGYSLEEIPTVTVWSEKAYPDEVYRNQLLKQWVERIQHHVATGQRFETMEVKITTKNQEEKWLDIGLVAQDGMFIVSMTDLTQRKQSEQKLQRAYAELEDKNGEMERYLYTVSHDLKSPIITIKGYTGYVEKALESVDLPQVKNDLKRIHSAADKATDLLEDLLALSRVGRKEEPRSQFSMEELLKEILTDMKPSIESAGGKVLVEGTWPRVLGSRRRLGEVWQNFLENSLKYRDPLRPLEVVISCKSQGSEVLFSQKDNGLGVEKDYLEKIFGIFEKIDPKSEGSGIGLAIVKRIIEFHGGRVWAEKPPQGLELKFILPRIQGEIDEQN